MNKQKAAVAAEMEISKKFVKAHRCAFLEN